MVLGVLWPLVLVFTSFIHRLMLGPLRDLYTSWGRAPVHASEKILRRILNLPITASLVNLGIWALISAIVVAYFWLFRDIRPLHCFFLFFRSFMIGMVSAGLSFFLLENHLRVKWIPRLFPDGRLSAVRGAVKIPVRRRIRTLWGAGTLNPMILLVGTLFFTWLEVREGRVSAEEVGDEIFLFTIILCVLFVAVALGLNFLVEKSIRGPVSEMIRVLKPVGAGDFSRRIRVVSNDEIGILGDAGNEMIAGLAERERIRETFGRYVTPEIRDRILSGLIPTQGERRTATVLFSDLRDFTPFVEQNPPEEVIRGMRAYFTAMQRAIHNRHGLVLQYVGDEVEASFGAPVPLEGHADAAVQASLDMRKALEDLNRDRTALGQTAFRHGIGIHSGQVLAGNTGSEDLLSYALIGETVNLAARIQELTKHFHWDILISEETANQLRGHFRLTRETPISVRGYSRAVTVYRVHEKVE
jgi:class 3 adenylate cyclase